MSKNLQSMSINIIDINLIEEGVRFREDYGDIGELVESIKLYGIIQPLCVTHNSKSTEKPYLLVAGGRRFHACIEAEVGHIPVRIYPQELTELELRSIELAENLHRKNLTWQEEAKLQKEIHILQQVIHGKAHPGQSADKKSWKMDDTANMLGVSRASISTNINLINTMDKFPKLEWEKCKTASDAQKMAKRISEEEARAELQRRAMSKASISSMDEFRKSLYERYIIGSCIDGMQQLINTKDRSKFDLAEIDPPYGIDLGNVKISSESCVNYVEVESNEYLIFMKKILELTYELLKDNSFCILWFASEPWFEYLYKIAIEVGFDASRSPLIWVKPNGQANNPNSSLASSYEMAFVLKKGTPLLAKPGRLNTFCYSGVGGNLKVHPTQRPLDLIKELLQTFSFEDSDILVPFAGSGTTILAASLCKRRAVGFDLVEAYKGGFIELVDETYTDK